MYDVKLPPWDWFEKGGTFSGSLCPNPICGSLRQMTMSYKARRVQDRLLAWCWFTAPWDTPSAIEETVIALFEGSAFGTEAAACWIRSKFLSEETDARTAGEEVPMLCG